MRKRIILSLFLFSFLFIYSCELDEIECATYNGNQLYRGPKDGCYYYNNNDNKTYVDRNKCNC